MSGRSDTGGTLRRKREQALLVGLADGALGGRRRMRAEVRLAGVAGREEALERQRRVARALRTGPVPPATLDAAPQAVAARRLRAGARRPRAPLLGTAAVLAAAAVVAMVVLVLPIGAPTALTAATVADLGTLVAEEPAPPRRDAALLAAGVEGVSFPDWGPEFGWHAYGARDDELEGRATRTVLYEHMGHHIAYTIVSGDALEPPGGAERIRKDGVEVALLRDGERDIAVFVRDGHTCVLSGEVLERATLVELAAWHGDGAVEF